jgi:hypothetical protein
MPDVRSEIERSTHLPTIFCGTKPARVDGVPHGFDTTPVGTAHECVHVGLHELARSNDKMWWKLK